MAHYAIIDKKTNIVLQVIAVSNDKCQSPATEKRMVNVAAPFSKEEKLELRDVTVLVDDEKKGIAYCQKLCMLETKYKIEDIYFKQTSYNSKLRKNFAGIGFTWREDLDGFVQPMPDKPKTILTAQKTLTIDKSGDAWLLDEKTCQWYWGKQSFAGRMKQTLTEIFAVKPKNKPAELSALKTRLNTMKKSNQPNFLQVMFTDVVQGIFAWLLLIALAFLIWALPNYFYAPGHASVEPFYVYTLMLIIAFPTFLLWLSVIRKYLKAKKDAK